MGNSIRRVVVPSLKIVMNLSEALLWKKNHIGSSISKIFRFRNPNLTTFVPMFLGGLYLYYIMKSVSSLPHVFTPWLYFNYKISGRDKTMADKLMYIINDDAKLSYLYITISGSNVWTVTLNLMNQPINIH